MKLPETLYVNCSSYKVGELEPDRCQLVLSPHEGDPCDAACFGSEWSGSPPDEEEAFFKELAKAWNAWLLTREPAIGQILERWDQTDPKLQCEIVVALVARVNLTTKGDEPC